MTEFGASATLTVTVDQSSLASARDEVEEALGEVTVGAAQTVGQRPRTDGGVAAAGGTAAAEDTLDEQLAVLEDILDELEQGAAGGGGGGTTGFIGGLGGGAALGTAGTAGLGVLAATTGAGLNLASILGIEQLQQNTANNSAQDTGLEGLQNTLRQSGIFGATNPAQLGANIGLEAGKALKKRFGAATIGGILGREASKQIKEAIKSAETFTDPAGERPPGPNELRNRSRSDPLTDPLDTGSDVTTNRGPNELRNRQRTGTLPTGGPPGPNELRNRQQTGELVDEQEEPPSPNDLRNQTQTGDINIEVDQSKDVQRQLDEVKREVDKIKRDFQRGGLRR
ncbi:hypothetical protein [Haloarcula pelagica]|uniref:hypothetical protein n=1 Tax=Haloarcula pelagica TaxID=3033389 RepID=UPI0024C25F1D|nr:hypothetical protein [Halomicroarcula sp. YJ-61-S]